MATSRRSTASARSTAPDRGPRHRVTDVLPVNEPRALDLAGRLYQLGAPP
jgi:hypothetical protein